LPLKTLSYKKIGGTPRGKKKILGVGAQAKIVTSNLPILSVLPPFIIFSLPIND